jgi:spore coat polysaccharide biosynthesis protein SpsF
VIRAFVQARMSSRRYPGKVLAPFRGEPVVRHVVRAAARALGDDAVVVLTSTDSSDDPLAAYLECAGVSCFRGPLEDVFSRFRLAAAAYPSTWIVRLCADSPLLVPDLVRAVVDAADDEDDVVSTVFPERTVPKGQAVELVKAAVLLAVPDGDLEVEEREHVFPYFYRRPDRYAIRNVAPECAVPEDGVVDTVDDLARLEARP